MSLHEFACAILNKEAKEKNPSSSNLDLKVQVQMVKIERHKSDGRGSYRYSHMEDVVTSVACPKYIKYDKRCSIIKSQCLYMSAFSK